MLFIVPLIAQADDERGWTDDKREKMVMGCMDSIVENVVSAYKQQSGLSPSDSLSKEVQEGLDSAIVPEVEKTCKCTIDKVEAEHTYDEIEGDITIMQRAGASIDTPEGCKLDI